MTIIRPWLKLTNPMQRLAIASKWKPEALFSLSDWCYMIENSDKNNDDVWQIFQCRKQMCKKAYKRSIEIGLLLNYKCIFVYIIYIYIWVMCGLVISQQPEFSFIWSPQVHPVWILLVFQSTWLYFVTNLSSIYWIAFHSFPSMISYYR